MALIGSFTCSRCNTYYENACVPERGVCWDCQKKEADQRWAEFFTKELSQLTHEERLQRIERWIFEGRFANTWTPDI